MKRISDKIKEIEEFLEQLKQMLPDTLQAFKANMEKKAACERYAEKIIEAITDLAFLAIKAKKLRIPTDDADAFEILAENKIISKSLAKKIQNAKGMRNIIAHQYGKIDDEIVFNSVTKELDSDTAEFMLKIKQSME